MQNANFTLTFVIETEFQIIERDQVITVMRNATEKPNITSVAEVIDPKIFNPK